MPQMGPLPWVSLFMISSVVVLGLLSLLYFYGNDPSFSRTPKLGPLFKKWGW